MHHAEADELRVLESGNEAQHARLLAPLDLCLEADEAEMIRGQIVLPQLHDRVRLAARARIDQTYRLHRSEPQRVFTAIRHHLDRQAPFEEALLVEIVDGRGLRRRQRVVERVVFVARHRTIQVVTLPVIDATRRRRPVCRPRTKLCRARAQTSIPPRSAKDFVPIDRLGKDDGADRVVEIQVLAADDLRDPGGQCVRRQRSGRDDHRLALGRRRDRRDLFADDGDQRVRSDLARDRLGEALAVHGERGAGRNAARFGRAHDERPEPAHFFLQQADRVIELVAAERVAAHELGEVIGLVDGGRTNRPHLVQCDGHAGRRSLPRRLAARKPSADDGDHG